VGEEGAGGGGCGGRVEGVGGSCGSALVRMRDQLSGGRVAAEYQAAPDSLQAIL